MAQPPEPTELIHLPKPSALPALFAAGLAGTVIGIYAWWPYAVAGALVAIISLVAWLRTNRDDIAALPREQRTDTAPIPLTAVRRRG
jgi:hypothetical protein